MRVIPQPPAFPASYVDRADSRRPGPCSLAPDSRAEGSRFNSYDPATVKLTFRVTDLLFVLSVTLISSR
jgi:hypothetical protein